MTNDNLLTKILSEKEWLLADGAIGTNFFKRGLETGYPPELWNVERPDDVLWLHNAFIAAGSDLILTNSFGGTSFRLKLHQAEGRVAELNFAAAKLARQAADASERTVLVAGSIGPTGELFNPLGALETDTAIAAFSEQADALAEGGADILWIETMSSVEEVEAAIIAAKKTGLPVCATMTFDTAGRSMMGVLPADFAELAVKNDLAGFGANCGIGPSELMDSVVKFDAPHRELAVIAKGNCGIPAYVEGEIHYHGSPELMAEYALFARDAGASIIGGCCGTTPEHIKAMHDKLSTTPRAPFDSERLQSVLGKAWKDIPEAPASGEGRQRSRRRKRDS